MNRVNIDEYNVIAMVPLMIRVYRRSIGQRCSGDAVDVGSTVDSFDPNEPQTKQQRISHSFDGRRQSDNR